MLHVGGVGNNRIGKVEISRFLWHYFYRVTLFLKRAQNNYAALFLRPETRCVELVADKLVKDDRRCQAPQEIKQR